jgi:hypothetical protein
MNASPAARSAAILRRIVRSGDSPEPHGEAAALDASGGTGTNEGVPDERAARIGEAERLLEEIGAQLLDRGAPSHELWPLTAFNLASHARSHHRALLEGLGGRTPRAAQIHGRPIVETALLIHYLADEPELRTWCWVADGLNQQLTMLREWRTSVERGEAGDASVEYLTEIIEAKELEVDRVEARAKEIAEGLGQELKKVELPPTPQLAAGDPHLLGLYTKGFRHLSGSIHVSATLFTENRYDEAMRLDEGLGDEDRLAIRALAASLVPVIYSLAAQAFGMNELAEKTGKVHDAMLELTPTSPD